MPKYNVDEQPSLFEPIEITLEGKTYIVEKVTQELMDKVTSEEARKDLLKQFNLLTGADIEELKKIDIRKIGHALKFLTKSITASFEGEAKNA